MKRMIRSLVASAGVAVSLAVLGGTAADATIYESYRGAFSSQAGCELDRSGNPVSPPFYTYPCTLHSYDPESPWKSRGPGWYWVRMYFDDEPGPPRLDALRTR